MKIAIHFTPIEYKYGLSRHIPLKCWIFFSIHFLDIGQSLVLNGMQCVHRNCIHSNRLYRSGEDIFNSLLHKQTLWDLIKYMEVYETTMACRYTWFKGKNQVNLDRRFHWFLIAKDCTLGYAPIQVWDFLDSFFFAQKSKV